ncbi:hypothetical protein Tco_1081591, partial [Tanacetum coccineum]
MIRAKLEDNTARLKKLVLLAEVSTASRARSQVIVGARDQAHSPVMVVPVPETTVQPLATMAQHQIPTEISWLGIRIYRRVDVDGILDALNEFYNSSDLKINVEKSNMYGVGVSLDEITNIAASTGCAAGNLPFNYLGITIGAS